MNRKSPKLNGSNPVLRYTQVLVTLLFALGLQISLLAAPMTCTADFEFEDYDGPLPQVGGITFTNLSTGNFTDVSWEFGDGVFSSDTSTTLDHFYQSSGVYLVKLSIWNGTDCMSDVTYEITVDLNNGTCNVGDCVYPGDVNLDGEANMYDLLPIGYGIGTSGPPRPNASLDFKPQPATDWAESTLDGINYKHLDCNGNGIIEIDDYAGIEFNYSAIVDPITVFETDGPLIYFDFDEDTIYLDDNTPDLIPLTARLVIGDPNNELEDCHGLALTMEYDTMPVDDRTAVNMQYDENSFLGDITGVFPAGLDLRNEGQFDMGFTKIDGKVASGSGEIASINFIIIHDIIGGRASTNGDETHFELPISAIRALDSLGNKLDVSIKKFADRVVFIRQTTSTVDPALNAQINIAPNPANNVLNVETGDLQIEELVITDLHGRQLLSKAGRYNKSNINIEELPLGLYVLQVYTDQGLAVKRFIKE